VSRDNEAVPLERAGSPTCPSGGHRRTDRPCTEYFAKQEALVSKVRLNGEANGDYGGFYLW